MALAALSGPRVLPARGQATHLVVLCHGYGSDGNDLIGLAPVWQRLVPTATFVAPNAPMPCLGSPGYQWFPITQLEPEALRQGVESAAPALDAFLDAELERAQLPGDKLALVGFSQGTMMSLQVGLRRAQKPAAIVGYSGLLTDPAPPRAPDAPPVLLVHGDADQVLPPDCLFISAVALGLAGVPVQWHMSPGTPHAIDETGLAMGGLFLAMAFRGQLASGGREISCSLA